MTTHGGKKEQSEWESSVSKTLLDVRFLFAYSAGGGFAVALKIEQPIAPAPLIRRMKILAEALMALTKRQKEVLDYLVSFETKHGYAPSFEEIGRGMKLTSLATVHKHISTLEKKGFIRRGYNQSRSIEIVQLPKSVKDQVIERRIQELPLVGRIAAGRPLEAVEERETLSLGDFARGGNSFVLQVKGTSMIEDHIMDGDYVVCEQTQVANAGDIVVALVGGEDATLKRFFREGSGKIRLQPANSDMAPILVPAADVKIQGRVIGVLRKY